MKNPFLLLFFPFFIAGYILFNRQNKERLSLTVQDPASITICGASPAGKFNVAANGKFIGPLPGWGKYTYSISTTKDSAQYYFNQGLNMYYGYHMKEALASFKEASRIDPYSAMTYWGQALAMGPYYNAAHSYVMPEGITGVLKKMDEVSLFNATPKEKRFIEVMHLRYSADIKDSKRQELNEAYAAGMKDLIGAFPEDLDVRMFYVDAVMLMHAWDFWNHDGTPKAWTRELELLCDGVMKTNAEHPGALHYQIHITEASRHPEVALANADKLKNNLPGIAHMVHMASHEYQRNGLYAKGVEVNDLADANLLRYDSLAKNLSLVKHSPHYFAVQTYCAMSGGMYKTGIASAVRCRKSVSPTSENNYDQYLFMMPVLTMVRLGKWEEILSDNIAPDAKWVYAGLLHNFAKGMAYLNTGKADQAVAELAALREKAKNPILEKQRIPFNTPLQAAWVAEEILNSAILFSQKNYDQAIGSLNKAILIEDNMIYTEPSDWPIPARQFLGAYLLKMAKPALAEKVYREDIMWNPGNGWSYIGLCKSLESQKKNTQLAEYKARYMKSFSAADQIPTGSVYMNY